MFVNLNDYKGRHNCKDCYWLPVMTYFSRGIGKDGKQKFEVVANMPGKTGDLMHFIVNDKDIVPMDTYEFNFESIGRPRVYDARAVALSSDKNYDVVIIGKDRSQRHVTYSAEEIVSISETAHEEYMREKAEAEAKYFGGKDSEEKDSGLGSPDKSEPKMGIMAKLRSALKAPKDKNATFNVNVEDNVNNERAKQVEGAFGDVADKAGTDFQASV